MRYMILYSLHEEYGTDILAILATRHAFCMTLYIQTLEL